jgi:small subunit ribosomal protein S6
MEQRKKIYETTFIANSTLDDAQIDQIVERFKEFLTKNGAEIRVMEKWGRKRLAYPIEKKNNGFYTICEFNGPADIIAKIERYYALDENVMRFLTVQLSEKLIAARKVQELKVAAELAAAAIPASIPAPVAAPVAVPAAAAPAPVKPESKAVPPGSQVGEHDEDVAT